MISSAHTITCDRCGTVHTFSEAKLRDAEWKARSLGWLIDRSVFYDADPVDTCPGCQTRGAGS